MEFLRPVKIVVRRQARVAYGGSQNAERHEEAGEEATGEIDHQGLKVIARAHVGMRFAVG